MTPPKIPQIPKITHVKNIEYVASGKRGCVFKGVLNFKNYKDTIVAIKTINESTDAINALLMEAKNLVIVNDHSIGPKIIEMHDEYIIMEFIEGIPIGEFLKTATKIKIEKVLRNIFEQLFILDEIKFNKYELTNPYKHIIIQKNSNKPVMIDFERARFSINPKNITQFIQYITSKNICPILQEKGFTFSKDDLFECVKEYKEEISRKHFEKILDILFD